MQVGPDRRKLIDSYLRRDFVWNETATYEYELMQYAIQFPHSYSKSEIQRVGDFELDDLYEAKAHKWMLNNIVSEKVLFWCVGRRFFDGMESIFAV